MTLKQHAWAAALIVCAFANHASAQSWMVTSAPNEPWSGIASSADGAKLIAVSGGFSTNGVITSGPIYSSTNFGATWVSNNAPLLEWNSVACSSSGNVLAAAAPQGEVGVFYISTNSGTTWGLSGAPKTNWNSVAVSPNGTNMAGVYWVGNTLTPPGERLDDYILVSSNMGTTWQSTQFPSATWQNLALSSNSLVARSGSTIYVSTNLGATYTTYTTPSSPAVFAFSPGGNVAIGPNFLSTNDGATWTTLETEAVLDDIIAVSASGMGIVVAKLGSYINITESGGTSWTNSEPVMEDWIAFASSADGTKWAAVDLGGSIWVSPPIPQKLGFSQSNNNLVFTWSEISGVILQQNSNLIGTNWSNTSYSENIVSNQVFVTAPMTNSPAFFRLVAETVSGGGGTGR